MVLGVLLEQLILLLPDLGGLLVVLLRSHRQGLERPLGLVRMPTGFGLLQSEIVRLLGKGIQLGHPLLGGNKLSYHLLA